MRLIEHSGRMAAATVVLAATIAGLWQWRATPRLRGRPIWNAAQSFAIGRDGLHTDELATSTSVHVSLNVPAEALNPPAMFSKLTSAHRGPSEVTGLHWRWLFDRIDGFGGRATIETHTRPTVATRAEDTERIPVPDAEERSASVDSIQFGVSIPSMSDLRESGVAPGRYRASLQVAPSWPSPVFPSDEFGFATVGRFNLTLGETE